MAYNIDFDLIEACNLSCACCLQGIKGSTGKCISLSTLKDCLQHLITHFDVEYIAPFNWSEPTLSPNIFEFLDLADSFSNVQTAFSSNMNTTLSDTLLDRLVRTVQFFILSVSGLEQDIYQRYHRKGNIRNVIANIDRLVQKAKLAEPGPHLTLTYGIHRYNLGEFPKLVNFTIQRNIDLVPSRYYITDMEDAHAILRGENIPKERYELLYETLDDARSDICSHLTPHKCFLMSRNLVFDTNGHLMLCCGTRISTGRSVLDIINEQDLLEARLGNTFCQECFRLGLPGYYTFTTARQEKLLGDLYNYSPENAEACTESAWFHTQTATVHVAREDFDSAESALERAVHLDPGSAPLRCRLANIHARRKNPTAAILAVREAIDRDDDNPGYHHFLGVLLMRTGDLDGAEHALHRALSLHPGHAPSGNALRALHALRAKA
ncbi:MAG: tetratricopeptide repeat protein [Desulfovibrionaceae bacterium]|nr:tetratricopeptide repeat protein [Desulfovibrionaceae bacterium]